MQNFVSNLKHLFEKHHQVYHHGVCDWLMEKHRESSSLKVCHIYRLVCASLSS